MYRYLLCFVAFALGFVACRRGDDKKSVPQPVKTTQVQRVDFLDRDFAGMATADDAVNMAFKIAGQVAGVDVSKGDYVRRGELLARLDSRDVELQVASDKAQYERARLQFERVSRLLEHEAVSQQEYESAESSLVQARSTY